MAASRNPLLRLSHIKDEIDQLVAALENTTYEVFAGSYVLRRTAEHAFLIISEAVKALPPDLTDRYPDVDWRAIRDIGNVLRHEYFEVDTRVLWRIHKEELTRLGAVVAQMISDLAPLA